MVPIQDLLQRLEKAKGDIRAQSALTTEFLIMARPEAERERLRGGLDAAAVLHWFDAELLEKVLEIPQDEARRQLDTLKGYSFVEHYRGEADLHYNLHESTRLGWRIRFAKERTERFRAVSLRASSCFADNPTPGDRIEWIYHLLCGDPELAASELENLDREWSASARPEDRSALAAVLRELIETKLVDGRARARSLLAIAWGRSDWETTSRLAEIATEALTLARRAGDESATADAWALKGRVLEAQGQLDTAQAAFDQNLAILRRLAKQDPSNAGWQRDLAVAYGQVAGVLEAQGRLEAAQAAFEQHLAILRRLAEQDPSNAGWQRELAGGHSRVGAILQAQGRLEMAQAAFDQDLTISRRLAEQDPSNAGWQRNLAVAHGVVGGVLEAQGQLAQARAAFDRNLAILRRLAEQDPSNAGRQQELAVAYSRVGGVLETQGRLEAAQAAFDQSLVISRRLAEQDPSNAGWQRELAVACLRVGRIAREANLKDIGLPLYEESLRIFAALVQRAPGFVQWAEDMKIVEAELTELRATIASPPDGAADGGQTP
jgi:tetratricopeptide (TPR) repeat protein